MTAAVRDRRRDPFARVELDALRAIRAGITSAHQPRAILVYLACCELATERRDYHGDGYEATLTEIGERAASSSRNTVLRGLEDLRAIGLVTRDRNVDEQGRDLPSTLVLHSPSGGSTSEPPGATASVPVAPPTRAGETSELPDEEKQRPPSPPETGGNESSARRHMGGRKGTPRQRGESPRQVGPERYPLPLPGDADAWRMIVADVESAMTASSFHQLVAPLELAGAQHPSELVIVGESAGYVAERYGPLLTHVIAARGLPITVVRALGPSEASHASTPAVESPETASLGGQQ